MLVFLHSLCGYRLSETESLINSHMHVPQCVRNGLIFPGLCNCGEDNSCSRLRTGNPTPAVLYDTTYTFLCANITSRYVNFCFLGFCSLNNPSGTAYVPGKLIELPSRVANHPGMDGIVPELTHGVPCPGRGSFCPGNVKIDHQAWIYGCSLMNVLYFVLCLSVSSHTRLDLSVMSLTNEIVIIRLVANKINNDEMQQA